MWLWAPTSNSVYGNFPPNRNSFTSGPQNKKPQNYSYLASTMQPGYYYNTGSNNNQQSNNYPVPLPAGSYLPQQHGQQQQQQMYYNQPSTNQPNFAAANTGATSNSSGTNNTWNNNGYHMFQTGASSNSHNGSTHQHDQSSAGEPHYQFYPPNIMSNQGGGYQVPSHASGDSNNSQEPSVEYLYGEEAEKVLKQLQISQYQQQNQTNQSQQGGTTANVANTGNQGSGENSSKPENNATAPAPVPTQCEASARGAAAASGDQKITETPRQQQEHEFRATTAPPAENGIQWQASQQQSTSQNLTQNTATSRSRPKTSTAKKNNNSNPNQAEDYSRYFYTYEAPPMVSPQPQPALPRVQSHHNQFQTPSGGQPSRKLSSKPTFHLCGRCTKCKMIRGGSTKSPAPNTFTLPKVRLGPVRSTTSVGPMGRQMSSTIFRY